MTATLSGRIPFSPVEADASAAFAGTMPRPDLEMMRGILFPPCGYKEIGSFRSSTSY